MRKLFTLLLAVAASIGTMSAAITVRLDPSSCTSWSTVRLWAWTGGGNLFDAWPGQIVSQDGDGWYSYTFGEDITSVSIIWNNGTYQTVDIEGVTSSTCYALNSTSGTAIKVSVVDCSSGSSQGGTPVSGKYKIGDLYYNLDATSQTAEVTYRGTYYYSYSNEYTGTVVIPASVTYNNEEYSVTSIGEGAFFGCSGLTSVTIPNSVTSIGQSAFADCDGLTSVTIPNSVTSIGEGAFAECSGLTSVTIPNSVTSIGEGAFFGCSGLTSINVASNNSIYCSVDGVLFNKDKTRLIQYPGGKQGAYTIPNSVTSIGNGAFYYCSSLTTVTIPNSVTRIGGWAFENCTGLTSVTNFANTPQEIDSYVFENVDKSTCVLYVPAGSISAYQSADVWKNFSNILPIGAQPADVTTTTVTPSETTADIAWPQVTGAATYTIEIKKNGELICTLTFNAQGLLISIAFNAPSRNNAPQQTQAAGFSFTVTSLDSGTTYSYT